MIYAITNPANVCTFATCHGRVVGSRQV